MYEYRDLSALEQMDLVFKRFARGFPAHEPPHIFEGRAQYLITAACYEHQIILHTPERRSEFANELISAYAEEAGGSIHAWVVLPNHYHVLREGELKRLRTTDQKLHGRTAVEWNREDHKSGRQVWYRLGDRRMRSADHYCATVNYIHDNPVKHGWTDRADTWPTTSFHVWSERMGRDRLIEMWRQYPIGNYGAGWDD
jgi:putative transposase